MIGITGRIITNIVNANLWRGGTIIYDPDRIPQGALVEWKRAGARDLMSSAAASALKRKPDAVIWFSDSQDGRPILRGAASLIIMDEHEFREHIGEAIERAALEMIASMSGRLAP